MSSETSYAREKRQDQGVIFVKVHLARRRILSYFQRIPNPESIVSGLLVAVGQII